VLNEQTNLVIPALVFDVLYICHNSAIDVKKKVNSGQEQWSVVGGQLKTFSDN
jgi:hypothetical protein